ncbi:Alpha 1,3 fucosyltransferase [Saguinus oedipus]|uniref:Alpha 1,3 fucosyltransferase n=1 Tax=Saguinus oedipus TaxID=9490 RepID=A0ABQ9U9G8_SAGOE|nr:Alpha 1,3 fucosyltransferase [Saguinus oedipus]
MEEAPAHLNAFLKKEALTFNRKRKWELDSYPIMLWWSPLTGETGRLGHCGADACFFTINRTYLHHHMTKAFLFYDGSMEGQIPYSPLPKTISDSLGEPNMHSDLIKGNYMGQLPST